MYFDGSNTSYSSRIGVAIKSLKEIITKMAFQLQVKCINNRVEYETIIDGLEMLLSMRVMNVQTIRDSQLIINQITRIFKCQNSSFRTCLSKVEELLYQFNVVII